MRSTLDRVCGWALLTLIFRPVAYGIFVASARHYVSHPIDVQPSHRFTNANFVDAGDAPKNSQRTASPTIYSIMISHETSGGCLAGRQRQDHANSVAANSAAAGSGLRHCMCCEQCCHSHLPNFSSGDDAGASDGICTGHCCTPLTTRQ